MKEKSKLTFKQKQDAVEKLFRQYHRAKLKLYCLENTSFYPEISTSLVKERKHPYGKNSIAARLNQRIDDKDDLKKLYEGKINNKKLAAIIAGGIVAGLAVGALIKPKHNA